MLPRRIARLTLLTATKPAKSLVRPSVTRIKSSLTGQLIARARVANGCRTDPRLSLLGLRCAGYRSIPATPDNEKSLRRHSSQRREIIPQIKSVVLLIALRLNCRGIRGGLARNDRLGRS